MGYIQSGREQGATCILGGDGHGMEGYFINPTIFTDVKPNMKIVQEEIFGPVGVVIKLKLRKVRESSCLHPTLVLITFVPEVIKEANDTTYGLACAVFTRDLNRNLAKDSSGHRLGKILWSFPNAVSFFCVRIILIDVEMNTVDVAGHEKESLRRIAFVAAFAMSNYSSTIGRIAKPFNPMLVSVFHCLSWTSPHKTMQSETFEYVSLDKQYRYVSEQVSHHPPISACWCESPSWNYYGEVRTPCLCDLAVLNRVSRLMHKTSSWENRLKFV